MANPNGGVNRRIVEPGTSLPASARPRGVCGTHEERGDPLSPRRGTPPRSDCGFDPQTEAWLRAVDGSRAHSPAEIEAIDASLKRKVRYSRL